MKHSVRFFDDKKELPDGPWKDEPDKIQWQDNWTGYPCLIVRNHSGTLCGYVGVYPDHPAYNKDYQEVAVAVHGGLTYSNFCQEGGRICHDDPDNPEKVWWLGFDTAHAGDIIPSMVKAKEDWESRNPDADYKSNPYRLWSFGGKNWDGEPNTYKDIIYVRTEVEYLARQLKKMAGEKLDH